MDSRGDKAENIWVGLERFCHIRLRASVFQQKTVREQVGRTVSGLGRRGLEEWTSTGGEGAIGGGSLVLSCVLEL